MSWPNTKLQQQQKASAQAQLSLSLSFEIPKSQLQSKSPIPEDQLQSSPAVNDSTEAAEENAKQSSNSKPQSHSVPIPYTIPPWSAAPCHQFQLEVLKDGAIINQFDNQDEPNTQSIKICTPIYFWPHLPAPINPFNDLFVLPMKRSVRPLFSILLLIVFAATLTCRNAVRHTFKFEKKVLIQPPKPVFNATLLRFAVVDAGEAEAKEIEQLLEGNLLGRYRTFASWRRFNHLDIRARTSVGLPEQRRYSSCAVVGNSGILLNSNHGALIDSHEVVIRLYTLLQSSSGTDHHHQNLEFGGGGFQDVVDQGGGYGGGFEHDNHSGSLDSSSLHASSGPDFSFSNNASNVETQSSNGRPKPAMFSASMSNPFPVSLSSGMFQQQQNMGLDEKPQIFNPQMVINQNQAQFTQNPAMSMPLTYAQLQEHHLLSPPPSKRLSSDGFGPGYLVQRVPFFESRAKAIGSGSATAAAASVSSSSMPSKG
ncbi:hypothetical protein ACFX10_017807 [Malus domestica]